MTVANEKFRSGISDDARADERDAIAMLENLVDAYRFTVTCLREHASTQANREAFDEALRAVIDLDRDFFAAMRDNLREAK